MPEEAPKTIGFVIGRYGVAAGKALLVTVPALLAARVIRHQWPAWIYRQSHAWLFVVGSWFLLAAAIGRPGWIIQSMGGKTPAERVDWWLFVLLSFLGTFMLMLDYFLTVS